MLVGLQLSTKSARLRAGASAVDQPAFSAEESLGELRTLAESAGASVEAEMIQARPAADAATLIGSGKLLEVKELVRFHEADSVVFDSELTPTQQRNLERALDVKVLDRTQLILDIFARRARTREGQLQVELAQLNYMLPRLTGKGIQLSRLGGGIGTRGPGETQLETDRRRIYGRIKKLSDDLEGVRSGRTTQRRQRQSVPLATLALVGYTNAGKSTLFNRMTGADVLADAKMFATLDPTVRHIHLPSRRKVLLSDTVGFIRNLPTTLVKAFRATLEEVTESALLLHVVDVSSIHAPEQTAHVFKVLSEIGAEKTAQILVMNKADLLTGELGDARGLAQRILGETQTSETPAAITVSARTGDGFEPLLALIDKLLPVDPVSRARFRFPVGEGSLLHLVHERGRVLSTAYDTQTCEVDAEIPNSLLARLQDYLKGD